MSGPFDGMLPKGREFRIELTKYNVLESGDPACPHGEAIEDATTKTRSCPCGRLEAVSERQVTAYTSEGDSSPC
jgi:hypothetical protein